MNRDIGVFVNPERPRYSLIRDEVLTAERLGFDSVWLSDHVSGLVGNPAKPFYECWTTTSALASETQRIILGQLVICTPFRHPPMVAKMGATLDSISDGRLILGLGARVLLEWTTSSSGSWAGTLIVRRRYSPSRSSPRYSYSLHW